MYIVENTEKTTAVNFIYEVYLLKYKIHLENY